MVNKLQINKLMPNVSIERFEKICEKSEYVIIGENSGKIIKLSPQKYISIIKGYKNE